MFKKNSEYKKIFEDSSLSDLQKYKKINDLHTKKILSGRGSRFLSIFIGLNVIVWPLLFIVPHTDTDNPNLSQIVLMKD
tara:strand:+ start:508 stop:744 length:237 start_codon:yes stop_codon:yes gene_type:complete